MRTAVQSGGTAQSSPLSAFARRIAPYVPVAVATSAVAIYAIRHVLTRCGHPAVPLDDAFIHFQYARRLAGGHFFSYVEGEGYSSGATSLLWPTLLAPFYLLGLHDLAIIWGAWALGFLALGALAVETYRLSLPLAGRAASVGAGAMVLCFGGYVWCAASGMEVVPLAWILAFAVRQCVEWGESPEEDRTPRRHRLLLGTSLAAPLLRPEGMLASFVILATLASFPGARAAGSPPAAVWRRRIPALLALVGPLVVPLLNVALTGHAASSTTMVKWLPGNPYYGHGLTLVAAVEENARILFDTLLDGKEWSAVYIPSGAKPYAIAALLAIPVTGGLRGRLFRAGLVLLLALSILVPCTYLTFLWNRLRYLWPFAFAWFIGLACLGSCAGELLASIRPQLRVVGAVVSFAFAGALASHLDWTVDDLAGSASAIDRQQVALGRWADAALPADARIGVNDTGAIGYLSNRRTFDVVGLTTPGEARYWVAGAGSRFEHYERLWRASPEHLPTHFIVYRHWMACDAVLGDALHDETVIDQTILGGTTMTAFAARYDLLGSGDAPSVSPGAKLIDELDVADLESESAHDYDIGLTRETDDQALSYELGDRLIADGARVHRPADRFIVRNGRRGAAFVIARMMADAPTAVEVRAGSAVIGVLHILPGEWSEHRFDLPADLPDERVALSLQAFDGGRFGSAHYWLYEK
ncbi:MAG TPA: hypothetical protein VF881_11485 [Polyangiaceae bacterium]